MVLGNFQCRGSLLIWIIEGQGPSVLAVGAGCCLDIFSLVFHFLSSFFWETARHCTVSKGRQTQNNQPIHTEKQRERHKS